MMNRCEGEEDPSSHRKKPKLSSPSSGLPEEMVLSCLARVSKSEHASLSLLLSTPELYNFRTLLGCTENLIYLCLRIPPDPNPRWFTLSLKKAPFDRRLVPVRSYFYQPLDAASMVAHGFGIYVMGGRIGGRASSSVKFLDCRSHTWSTLPSMGVPRYSAASGVVDGKIYIFGGCDDRNSSRWGEVFDTEKQTWDALPLPPPPFSVPSMLESVVINEEKVVAMNLTSACFSYIPSESKWKIGNQESSGAYRCWHVIHNVVYCSGVGGRISWCEAREWESPETETTHVMEWREVMGLESLTETLAASKLVNYGGRLGDYWESIKPQMLFPTRELDEQLPGHRLCNSGNNMLIFWDVLAPNKLEIWCAEVSLERHTKEEIRANILWSQPIMTLDPPPPHQLHSHILHASPLNL